MYDRATPAAVFEVLKNYKAYHTWFQKCQQSDDSSVHVQSFAKGDKPLAGIALSNKSPIISQVFRHSSLEFPFNEKELLFQAFTQAKDDVYFIALKSDTKLIQQTQISKNSQGLGAIVNVAQSKFSHQNKFNKVYFKDAEKIRNLDANQKIDSVSGFIIRPR